MNGSIKITGATALAVAAMLAASPGAFAQHRGGMSGGAWHGGGGSFHGGSWNGGNFHGGSWNGGGWNNGAWHGGGFNNFRGYGYGWGYPGFGLYLGFGLGGYGYGDGYGYAPSYTSSYSPTYVTPDYSGGADAQQGYTPDISTTARLDIRVPADAEVWVEGVKMQQTGAFRQMISPPSLEAGKTYHYTVKATWTVNGQPVTEERKINVQAGLASLIDFTKPANAAPAPPPAPGPNPANPPARPAPITPPTVNPPIGAARVG